MYVCVIEAEMASSSTSDKALIVEMRNTFAKIMIKILTIFKKTALWHSVHLNKLKYTEILSLERERFAGVTKVNAFYDGLKILKGMLNLRFRV